MVGAVGFAPIDGGQERGFCRLDAAGIDRGEFQQAVWPHRGVVDMFV